MARLGVASIPRRLTPQAWSEAAQAVSFRTVAFARPAGFVPETGDRLAATVTDDTGNTSEISDPIVIVREPSSAIAPGLLALSAFGSRRRQASIHGE